MIVRLTFLDYDESDGYYDVEAETPAEARRKLNRQLDPGGQRHLCFVGRVLDDPAPPTQGGEAERREPPRGSMLGLAGVAGFATPGPEDEAMEAAYERDVRPPCNPLQPLNVVWHREGFEAGWKARAAHPSLDREALETALRPFDGCWSWGIDVRIEQVIALENAARASLDRGEPT